MPWLAFKGDSSDPGMIGRLISALSNAARLAGRHCAYVLWGVRAGNPAVFGTTFDPGRLMAEGQPLDPLAGAASAPGYPVRAAES